MLPRNKRVFDKQPNHTVNETLVYGSVLLLLRNIAELITLTDHGWLMEKYVEEYVEYVTNHSVCRWVVVDVEL